MDVIDEWGKIICSSCNGDLPEEDLVEGKCIWCWDREARDAGS